MHLLRCLPGLESAVSALCESKHYKLLMRETHRKIVFNECKLETLQKMVIFGEFNVFMLPVLQRKSDRKFNFRAMARLCQLQQQTF